MPDEERASIEIVPEEVPEDTPTTEEIEEAGVSEEAAEVSPEEAAAYENAPEEEEVGESENDARRDSEVRDG